jgi:hypothetical protein
MSNQLPLDAEEIHIKWRIDEGGIGVTAYTDEAGLPYIGLYPLNWEGQPTGLPVRFQRRRLMADVVAGFLKRKPIVVFIDAEATARGLELTTDPPPVIVARGYERHKFSSWGSEAPRYAMIVHPANSNWPIIPYPRGLSHEPSAHGGVEKEQSFF